MPTLNGKNVAGWGVVREWPWDFVGLYETQIEATSKANGRGQGYAAHYGETDGAGGFAWDKGHGTAPILLRSNETSGHSGARDMFRFKAEPDLGVLTATRIGFWTLENVTHYETALRSEMATLHLAGRPTAFIVDIRSSGAQSRDVANALRRMVAGLGSLHADRYAVVTSSGLVKLEAKRVADLNARVFTSMTLAREWVLGRAGDPLVVDAVLNEPSTVDAIGPSVHIHGPSSVDVTPTAPAAIETAKWISDAALTALLDPDLKTGP